MINIRIRYVFSLLFNSCQEADEHLIQPTDKKYMLSLSDGKILNLLSQAKSDTYSNGRLSGFNYREDSAMVIEAEDYIKYSIPIEATVSGASENLVLESNDLGLQKVVL